ncbi:hypothetical protein NL676_021398 [Syzygium grande]|nr:hypothetical protein NL676_021398 [Syzygium grande]
MFSRERCIFLFDENSLNSTSTSRRTSSLSTTILSDGQVSDGGRVALEALPAAASSSQLPRSVPPSSDEEEGFLLPDFDLFFGGEVLAEDRTLASLNLPPEPTFHLVLIPKEHLSVIVDMSSLRVTVDAKLSFSVGHVKALALAKMSAEIFVECGNGKTVALQVCRSDTVKEVNNKLLRKLQVIASAKLHDIAYAGQRLADDRDLASYGIRENSTLFGIISPHSKSKALSL